jgi:hypothetical protein
LTRLGEMGQRAREAAARAEERAKQEHGVGHKAGWLQVCEFDAM